MTRKTRYADSKARGMCPNHPNVPAVEGHITCQQCIHYQINYHADRWADLKTRGICPNHPNVPAVEGRTVCQECLDRMSNLTAIRRSTELIIVAQRWGDDTPRCRVDLTPQILEIPCKGALTVDHLDGGGRQETKSRTAAILNGSRLLDDLRILCELHQWAYAIFRGDTHAESTPEEWI